MAAFQPRYLIGPGVFPGEAHPSSYISSSRAELYSPLTAKAAPVPAAVPPPPLPRTPQPDIVPHSVNVRGRDVPLWRHAQLAAIDVTRLRQRATFLRDAFAPEQRDALPGGDALRSGDRRRLVAWILDAQLCLARLCQLDPARRWSVTVSFGAPADLGDAPAAGGDITDADAPPPTPLAGGSEVEAWPFGESNESLIPHGQPWYQPWRPRSSSGASSRGSSRAGSAVSSSVDPRDFEPAPPRALRPAPAGAERYAWPWRSDSHAPTSEVLAAGAPSRPRTADAMSVISAPSSNYEVRAPW